MTVVQHSYSKLRIIVSQSRQDAMAVRRGGKSYRVDHNFFAALRPARRGGPLREEKKKKLFGSPQFCGAGSRNSAGLAPAILRDR